MRPIVWPPIVMSKKHRTLLSCGAPNGHWYAASCAGSGVGMGPASQNDDSHCPIPGAGVVRPGAGSARQQPASSRRVHAPWPSAYWLAARIACWWLLLLAPLSPQPAAFDA
jgi:hypothetical protein